MFQLSGKFHEQFNSLQSQFQQWRTLEQIYAIVELSKNLPITNHYFLFQYFENLIDPKKNEMLSHTADQANSPEVVACQRTRGFEKLSLTLQLFLPLVGQKNLSKELIEAYRQNLLNFDSALSSMEMLNDNEQNLQLLCQNIYFYLSNNAALNLLIVELPHLVRIVKKNSITTHRPLQRNPSIRYEQANSIAPLMNCSSEGSKSAFSPSILQPSLKHHDTKDSGVDLTENSFNNSWRTSPSPSDSTTHNSRQFLSHRNTSNELNPMASRHMPLMPALSAPSYSDHRPYRNPVRRSLKIKTTLAKSDEEEEINQNEITPSKDSSQEKSTSDQNSMINNRRVKQFNSLRCVGTDRLSPGLDNVSQYLDVDSAPTKYSLVQWKPGMKNIPLWLKYLRLHKYTDHFCRMSYDEMLNLTKENLKALNITNGACAKILLNIQKLKTRCSTLRQALDEFDRSQIDLTKLFQIVNEVALTPILPKTDEQEDLPSLIIEALEKVSQNLDVVTSPEIGHDLINIFDVCYRHEAFTDQHRHVILQRRGRLSNSLQQVSRPEYRLTNVALTAHASQPRRYMKPTVRAIKSSSAIHHSDYSNPLGGFQTNSSPLMGPASMRHLIKSSTQNYSLNTEFNENNSKASGMQPNSTYLTNHQHPTLARKPSINPYGENDSQKSKLCKTFSEPYTMVSFNDHLSPSSVYRNASNSTPYSQQQFPVRTRLPPSVTQQTNSFPSQHQHSNYFDASNENTDQDSTEEQRQKSQEFESLCRQITESALSDDEHQREESSHSSSAHSADSEQ